MKMKYIKMHDWLIAAVAGLMGMNVGCERFVQCEYGCPEADYEVKGRVTTMNDEPIEGIGVMLSPYNADTTEADGRYCLSYGGFPRDYDTARVSFSDIDGEENGHYADTIVEVVFRHSDLQGGDGSWYEGRATKEVDVRLRKFEE